MIDIQAVRNAVARLNSRSDGGYELEGSYGKYTLTRNNGSVRVSPLLPKAALYDWLWAYMDGMDLGYARGMRDCLGSNYQSANAEDR